MSHAERPGAEPRDQAAWLKRLVGNSGAMKDLQAIAGGIAERDEPCDKALVGERGGLARDGDAGALQPRRQRIECGRVLDLPAEILDAVSRGAVEHQALLAVIHAEGARPAA